MLWHRTATSKHASWCIIFSMPGEKRKIQECTLFGHIFAIEWTPNVIVATLACPNAIDCSFFLHFWQTFFIVTKLVFFTFLPKPFFFGWNFFLRFWRNLIYLTKLNIFNVFQSMRERVAMYNILCLLFWKFVEQLTTYLGL